MKGRKSGAIFCHLCHIMQQERGVQGKTLCNHQPQFYAVGRSENLGENGRGRGWRGQIAIQGLSREKELLLFLPKFWVELPPCPPPGSAGPYHTWPAPKVSKWVQNSTEKRCIASYLFSLIIFIFPLLLLEVIKITLVKCKVPTRIPTYFHQIAQN